MEHSTVTITARIPTIIDIEEVHHRLNDLISEGSSRLSGHMGLMPFVTDCDVTLENRSRLTGSNDVLLMCVLCIPAWKIVSKLTDKVLDEVGSWLGKLIVGYIKNIKWLSKKDGGDVPVSAEVHLAVHGKKIDEVHIRFPDMDLAEISIDLRSIAGAVRALDRESGEQCSALIKNGTAQIVCDITSHGNIITLVEDADHGVSARKAFVNNLWLDVE